MGAMYSLYTQAYPPAPKFTDKDVPDLTGKVYLVTGANTGLGKTLSQILYSKNAKVYIAARSPDKAAKAIEDIKAAVPQSSGSLVFLQLDLADLTQVAAAAREFLAKENSLHVLFNNAGVMLPDPAVRTAQGYEMQLGVNCLGTFLLTKLLTPVLAATAEAEGAGRSGSVRVVFVSSSAADSPGSTPNGGVDMENVDYSRSDKGISNFDKYARSKAGNYLHAVEYARRHKADGVVAVALNPGNLNSDLWRTQGPVAGWFIRKFVLHPVIYGVYTELFAGFSPTISMENTGSWIIPWGRLYPTRKDLIKAAKLESEGGSGIAKKFWDWSEEQVRPFC